MAKRLFYILIGIFGLLMIQEFLPYIKSGKLHGAFKPKTDIAFSWKKWWTGEYQNQKEEYLNENFPFRNDMVRLNNQIDYSLFGILNSASVIGKDKYLYEQHYIDAYFGKDFVGTSTIDNQVKEIKTLQEALSNRGKYLITVIAAGKGQYYPEYFPKEYENHKKDSTNYETFVKAAERYNLNFIDYSKWIVGNKKTSSYQLYPKTGIHWSMYSAGLVIDSLSSYMDNLTGLDLPDVSIEKVDVTSDCRTPDCDAEQGLNLIFPMEKQSYAYPTIHYNAKGKQKLRAIVVGDSFFFPLLYHQYIDNYFAANSGFWFYYNSVFPERPDKKMARDVDLQNEIKDTDIIILLYRDAAIQHIGNGFISKANSVLK